MSIWILALVFLLLLITLYFYKDSHKKNLPPGPSGLPFIGTAFQLDPNGPHKTMTAWAKKYGDIIKFKMFGTDCVLLSSYDLIHEALVTKTDDFAGRPSMFRFMCMYCHTPTIVASDFSKKWTIMKKVAKQGITTFGNTRKLETISREDIEFLMGKLETLSMKGEPVDLRLIVHQCTTTIISAIVFGDRLSEKAVDEITQTEHVFNEQTGQAGAGVFLDVFPWLRHFPLRAQFKEVKEAGEMVYRIVHGQLELARERYIPGEPKCYVDGLFEYQRAGQEGRAEILLTDDDVYAMTYDVINAGTGTSFHTVNALLAVLTNKPEIQANMTREIRDVIGERSILLDDRAKLPYVEACILEIVRYHTMLPLGFAHKTTKDTTLAGYDISEGTTVFFNKWWVHHDPEFWDEPWDYKPQRFLDDNGELLSVAHPNRKRALGFSEGRRKCLGDVLALNRMVMMVASLFQHFHILPESDDKRPRHDPRDYKCGFVVEVHPFKVLLKRVD